jgi:hypothetical protein
MAMQNALRADEKERVVQRAWPMVLSLVYTDCDVDLAPCAHLHEASHMRPGDVHAGVPQPLPQFVAALCPCGG